MENLLDTDATIKVSSTLDKSVGRKHLTDGSPETCWTSQTGSPQFIQIIFDVPVVPSQLSITFQGGFVGVKTLIQIKSPREDGGKSEWKPWTTVYPEDVNRAQIFELSPQASVESGIDGMKLVFEESSDFFGRITVYDLQTRGRKLNV